MVCGPKSRGCGVAVALVVFFHPWLTALPGGYVGVDVFFVISGFLITGLLARMATAEGHGRSEREDHRHLQHALHAACDLWRSTFAARRT